MLLTPDQVFPVIGASFGLAVCLSGGRFTRLYCFVLGFLLATNFTFWLFNSQAGIRHGGAPLIVGLLVSLLGGIICLLLHMFSVTAILGFSLGSMLLVLDNGYFFAFYRTYVYAAAFVFAAYYTFRRPHHSLIVTTAISGALLLTLAIDAYATRSFGALIFQNTFMEYTMEVEGAVARCFNWRCWLLIPFWFATALLGYGNQTYAEQLRLYQQSWPLLFVAPKRGNYQSSSRKSSPVTESLIAEDRNYTITNYASYDNYQKQQQAQQAQSPAHQPLQTTPAVPTAAPELGSAHADDKVAAPSMARATHNFLEMKRLPPQFQYLYLVIQNSFQGLVRTYGFQQDNMLNQYEHLIFLLTNYQSKPSMLQANLQASQLAAASLTPNSALAHAAAQAALASGQAPAGAGVSGTNNDAISQLHTKLFTNYREWIRYMNLGGNSAMGGSVITTEVVPHVKSAISDARVDKNTTDAKIEEICLWLLVWGEAGSLRHTPECLIYLFHHMCTENRRYQTHFGGGFLDAPAQASAQFRPKRAPGDFLKHVVQPIYAVMAAENKKPDGRNYDDLNEFFWRKSTLQYYYASPKYRVENDEEAGSATGSAESSFAASHPRSAISVSAALANGKKSFLEKRSWIHPARSFMRLITFYGVAFHLLVCLAYVHYAQLPLLDPRANKILSSFVISIAGWSVLRELLEIWATYGVISESIWNTIGFIMRLTIKVTIAGYLILFYTWSCENDNPVLQEQYYSAYLLVACLYLIPVALSILTQLFPTLGARIQQAKLPFFDEASKFWYPIHKLYVGRDVHEVEKHIYRYQVFWVLLLMWKMYMSLLFQVSPLIQPTIDILNHIGTLSISTRLWVHYLYYTEIVLLWAPFILVYMFDTVIWYFLWQAIMGIVVGMKIHLGEIREFTQLRECFAELPKQFDRKMIFTKNRGLGALKSSRHSGQGSQRSSPQLGPIKEGDSLLSMNRDGHMVANAGVGVGGYQSIDTSSTASLSLLSAASSSTTGMTPNFQAPLSTARGRRGSIGAGGLVVAAPHGGPVVLDDPFRNRAWENYAVVWNEIVEDLRTGDLISNAERGMLRFRFDTTSEKEYYLPLFLMVGHIDAAIDKGVAAHSEWKAAHAAAGEMGLDSSAQARAERALFDVFLSNAVRKEAVRELWEHLGWLLVTLLGERHQGQIQMALAAVTDLLITHQHVLRGTNLAALPKVKADLLNLVRGLRIASASFATLKLAEAERDRRSEEEREREEQEELEREEERRERMEAEAEAEEAAASGLMSSQQDTSDTEEEAVASRRSRKTLIRDAERSTAQGSLARAREFNLKSMLKSPSTGTLNMLEKLQARPRHRSAAFVATSSSSSVAKQDDTGYLILHISLIRDQLSALLNSLASCLDPTYNSKLDRDSNHATTNTARANPDVSQIITALKGINMENGGFMWDGAYAGKQIHAFLKNSRTNTVLNTVHSLLTIASIDAEPKSPEAVRRLLFFSNSLFMDLPVAPSIRSMKSLSTMTPFHSEDILYSFADLEKKTEDGVSVFLYLSTIYPLEWQNFLQRCGISEDAFNTQRGGQMLSTNKKWNMEARVWATMRGQTLLRTVDGMMLYEKALKLLLKIEEPDLASSSPAMPNEVDDASLLVQQKYQYVVSCQVYGKQKRENDPKAADIEYLLHKYPSIRVAYIDTVKVPTKGANGQTSVVEEFHSVLIKSERSPTGAQEIKEVYRIKLPGNPVLGEGKPENQNHAIIFTRGECLQTIDMNQSNYLEEALKMRNLLEEFNAAPDEKKVGIVGFREHIFTGGLSSIANFMALQEGTFVTQGQRVLDNPLRVRFHYGHPDVFDKLFFMSRGGVSKASRGINLSEDIFAGFNSVLRGGSVKFREYIQCGKGRDVGLQQLFKFEAKLAQGNAMQSISRDVYRLANTVDFFRLLSFFFGGVGFYITNTLTIWALYLFIYTRLILAGFRLESLDSFSGADTISYWFGMIGFLLTLPVFATIGLERGFRRSLLEVLRMFLAGGPLFFMFHMGTKSYYLEQTMLAGGAKYRPTGRGFVTRHEHFSEIYRFHAMSHFYRSVEMLLALLLYIVVIPPTYSYSLVTWGGWLIVVAWLFGPFWFNPLAFEWEKTLQDFGNFAEWMERKEGDGDRCWRAWWKDETSYLNGLTLSTRAGLACFQIRYLVVAASLVYFVGATREQVLIAAGVLLTFLSLVVFIRARIALVHQFAVRSLKAVLVVALVGYLLYLVEFYQITPYQYFQFFITVAASTYVVHACCNVALILGVRMYSLMQWFKFVDWMIAGFIFCILGALSVTVIPGVIQTRLMFHNAFSRGVLIDKLLKTKPDDPSGGSAAATPAARPSASRRRKDARGSGNGGSDSKNDSPEDTSPEPSSSSTGGFDLDAISFIERRGGGTGGSKSSRKKLHPSKQAEASDEDDAASKKASKKGTNVSFAFGGGRKVPSISNLDDLVEDVSGEAQMSPQPPAVPHDAQQSPPLSGTFAHSLRFPSPSHGGLHAPPITRSAGSTPTGGVPVGGLPMYPAPMLPNVLLARTGQAPPGTVQRSTSDQQVGGGGAPFSLGLSAHSASNPALSASSSGRVSPSLSARASPSHASHAGGVGSSGSPAPSSPYLGAAHDRRSDKLIGGLPNQALQDERPIPKTVTAPAAVTKSPLNPRRA